MNRRDFLAGGVALAAPLSVLGQEADSIGTGFIGAGNRGSHLLSLTLKEPGVKVTAVCDIKPDRLDRAATTAARDKAATYSDYRKLLERKDVQAVFIATPCDLHVEMAIAALKAGKHVYCEKPVGITPESIRELVKVAKSSKTVFQTGLQRRSEPRLKQTIARIHEGVAGKVIYVKAQRHGAEDLAHDGSSADWFFFPERSGDLITENSVHNLDVCNWIINSYPERATGFGGNIMYVNDPQGDGEPVVLATPEEKAPRDRHIAEFYECIRTGKKPFADIVVGASGALTSIIGREAIYRKKIMTWQELGVEL